MTEDPFDQLRRELRKGMERLVDPIVEWVARRSPWQFAALYAVVGLAFMLAMVWTVTHP